MLVLFYSILYVNGNTDYFVVMDQKNFKTSNTITGDELLTCLSTMSLSSDLAAVIDYSKKS